MIAIGLDAEPAESVAAVAAALTRALTGTVTEADLDLIDAVVQQVQVRVDAQQGATGRVTYDVTDDHPGQTGGEPGNRGGAVRSVRMDLPGSVGLSLEEISGQTGKDLAFLIGTAAVMLSGCVGHLRAGRHVYAEDPTTGRRSQMTLDWVRPDEAGPRA